MTPSKLAIAISKEADEAGAAIAEDAESPKNAHELAALFAEATQLGFLLGITLGTKVGVKSPEAAQAILDELFSIPPGMEKEAEEEGLDVPGSLLDIEEAANRLILAADVPH